MHGVGNVAVQYCNLSFLFRRDTRDVSVVVHFSVKICKNSLNKFACVRNRRIPVNVL
jgi:hypothetical protein